MLSIPHKAEGSKTTGYSTGMSAALALWL